MAFTYSVISNPPESHLTLHGELDLASAPVVSARLYDEIEGGCRRLLIDLSDVTFADASALTLFTQARHALLDKEGTMEFVAFQPMFLQLCRATGLAGVFGVG
jgi:anti-sigma B factor antagonist